MYNFLEVEVCILNEIKRDLYLNKLIDRMNNGLIKVITGIRRCGKSYLLFNIFYNYLLQSGVENEQIIRISLDGDENATLRDPQKLSDFLYSQIRESTKPYYVLLDEVQFAISDEEIRKNEPIRLYGILNGLLRKNNVDIYVTGSNSKFLSSDVMTEFRGRGDVIQVYPLSFSEFYSAYGGDKYEAFDEYTLYGGLPLVLAQKNDSDKSKYLIDNLKLTYIKDIVERNHLHGDVVMANLVEILASSIGSLTNPKKLSNTFKSSGTSASDNTISEYISYLSNAFLISRAERYDVKGKKYISSPYKFYFSDIGIRNAALNFRQQELTHILENIIYNELLIRGYNVDVGIVYCSGKTKENKHIIVPTEIDFICNLGNQKYYIQSALNMDDEEKQAVELRPLYAVYDSFKKIVVSKSYGKSWTDEKGVLRINIIDFLLDKNSLNRI